MFSKADYAMINVSDMGRSVAFYRDTLGLKLKFESPGWSEFDTGATTIALHKAGPARPPQAGEKGEPCAGTCSIGFTVPDVDATFKELQTRGARFVMPPVDQQVEGIRLAVCIDPDGLAISFAQMLKR
jgi:lactoylglutathione lyase